MQERKPFHSSLSFRNDKVWYKSRCRLAIGKFFRGGYVWNAGGVPYCRLFSTFVCWTFHTSPEGNTHFKQRTDLCSVVFTNLLTLYMWGVLCSTTRSRAIKFRLAGEMLNSNKISYLYILLHNSPVFVSDIYITVLVIRWLCCALNVLYFFVRLPGALLDCRQLVS